MNTAVDAKTANAEYNAVPVFRRGVLGINAYVYTQWEKQDVSQPHLK